MAKAFVILFGVLGVLLFATVAIPFVQHVFDTAAHALGQ